MNGPITVTVASLKANRGKWVRFVKAYLEATHYMTTNKEGSMRSSQKNCPGATTKKPWITPTNRCAPAPLSI